MVLGLISARIGTNHVELSVSRWILLFAQFFVEIKQLSHSLQIKLIVVVDLSYETYWQHFSNLNI